MWCRLGYSMIEFGATSPLTIALFVIILSFVAAILAEKLKVSYTTVLILIGFTVSFLGISGELGNIPLDRTIILGLLVPPMIFQAAMRTRYETFRTVRKTVLALAIFGVVVSALASGAILNIGLGLPLAAALTFGVIVSPTDPVSVVNALKRMRGPERLTTILETEAYFNDATAVMLYPVALSVSFSPLHEGRRIRLHFGRRRCSWPACVRRCRSSLSTSHRALGGDDVYDSCDVWFIPLRRKPRGIGIGRGSYRRFVHGKSYHANCDVRADSRDHGYLLGDCDFRRNFVCFPAAEFESGFPAYGDLQPVHYWCLCGDVPLQSDQRLSDCRLDKSDGREDSKLVDEGARDGWDAGSSVGCSGTVATRKRVQGRNRRDDFRSSTCLISRPRRILACLFEKVGGILN